MKDESTSSEERLFGSRVMVLYRGRTASQNAPDQSSLHTLANLPASLAQLHCVASILLLEIKNQLPSFCTMSNSKIGGEYGEIRSEIDVQALNKYLGQHAKEVKIPVEVKQFKVSNSVRRSINSHLHPSTVWSG